MVAKNKKIKDYCKSNNIKLKDFAEKAGITPIYLSQIICGYRSPSAKTAAKIINASNGDISFHDLVQL